MGNIKEINIKNRTYYFFDDMINIKDFDPNLLKTDKKSYKNIDIYYVGYITMKDSVKIISVNPFYIIINEVDGTIASILLNYCLLTFASTDRSKKVLKNIQNIGMKLKNKK